MNFQSLRLAAASTILLLAACGDSDSSTTGGAGGNGTGGSTTTQNVGGDSPDGSTSGNTTSGDGGSGGGTTGSGGGECAEITAMAFECPYADGDSAFYEAFSMPDQGGADQDQLGLEFYDLGKGTMFTGKVDLGQNQEANYGTCERCVVLAQDVDAEGGVAKVFFATSGTLDIDAASNTLGGTIKATLTDVTLVEVTIDEETSVSTPVVGGACLHLETATVDAMLPEG